LLSVARSTLGYTSRLATRDQPVVVAMRELAGRYPRYGDRKPRPLLPTGLHHVWAYDFLYDWCVDGRALNCDLVTAEIRPPSSIFS
jgi:hypothetical protein